MPTNGSATSVPGCEVAGHDLDGRSGVASSRPLSNNHDRLSGAWSATDAQSPDDKHR